MATTTRKQDRVITFLTQEEVQRLFSAIQDTSVRKTHPTDLIAKKRDRAIFAVAYRHGLRASEVGILHAPSLT